MRKYLGFILLVLPLWPAVIAAIEPPVRLPPDPNELPSSFHCPVDGEPVEDGRYGAVWQGRRYFMDREECLQMFLRNPEPYAREIEPRAALFSAPNPGRSTYGPFFFYFGVYVVLGLLSGGVTAYVAVQKGLDARFWFFIGLLLNVIAIVAVVNCQGQEVLFQRKGLCNTPQTHEPDSCASCGRLNHPSATRCSGCGQPLEPTVKSEVTLAGSH